MIKKGLVLGGGGSKGAYEIGVWKATRELDIHFDVVTGTSIGALNGALVVQGDYESAEQMWLSMRYETVMANVKTEEFQTLDGTRTVLRTALREIVSEGGMDISPLEELVRGMLDEERVRRSPVRFGMVTVELPSLKEMEMTKENIPRGEMANYLLASSACYPAFKPRAIGESKFVDGGYKDNLPIGLAVDMGAREIVAVDLRALGLIPKHEDYGVPVRYIRPYWDLGIFLTFDPERIRRNIAIGYLDTMKAYGRYEGYAYAFEPGEVEQNHQKLYMAMGQLCLLLGVDIQKSTRNPLEKVMQMRMKKAVQLPHRRGENHRDLVMRSAELAGELLGVAPVEAYTFPQFNRILTESFTQVDVVSREEIESALKNIRSDLPGIARLAKQIRAVGSEQLLSYLYGAMDDTLHGRSTLPMPLLAAALPTEFAAACYIYLLRHLTSPEELTAFFPAEEPQGK